MVLYLCRISLLWEEVYAAGGRGPLVRGTSYPVMSLHGQPEVDRLLGTLWYKDYLSGSGTKYLFVTQLSPLANRPSVGKSKKLMS